ncbi:hypothetical protein BX616_011126 [Lobosporangium transversale]|uniref:Acyl-CoA N-acyltransferase n=1 Tax=Lobosporangium transversale TaxID=64571 RepID=A0A1Y2GL96_9FUNG|nr:acyl-CoA N-acyltransferase [Lobosporangium transversale]KAF9909586.1 hypothetical protein BX616_011126 [Lobosporangium transversale]ORZ14443.1 acyl-CoA N-acyltransferase [Lobosporangium transversale]|eukprot:XP_021880921.1 acyl-CoA N-acyltransferase [Lobosporangium transversale]
MGASFKLDSATPADIDAIAQISGDAFLNDTHTLLKAVWQGENNHRDGTKQDLVGLFGKPNVDIIVARQHGVDHNDDRGEILGFVIWATWGYPEKNQIPMKHNNNNSNQGSSFAPSSTTAGTTTSRELPLPPPPPPPPSPVLPLSPSSPLTIGELRQTTNNAMVHYSKYIMVPGIKCRYIYGISVAPAYQGQGIGSALLKWGTDKADEEGVSCWVSSSMSGWPAFAKAGFVEVGRLELNLDDYAQGIKRKIRSGEDSVVKREEDWGTYIWRWMRRDPTDTQ